MKESTYITRRVNHVICCSLNLIKFKKFIIIIILWISNILPSTLSPGTHLPGTYSPVVHIHLVLIRLYTFACVTFCLYNSLSLITNTSEEFIKCRLDNCSMSFILRKFQYLLK